jgi:hypothetical protein
MRTRVTSLTVDTHDPSRTIAHAMVVHITDRLFVVQAFVVKGYFGTCRFARNTGISTVLSSVTRVAK